MSAASLASRVVVLIEFEGDDTFVLPDFAGLQRILDEPWSAGEILGLVNVADRPRRGRR
jgi:hypothetical protein